MSLENSMNELRKAIDALIGVITADNDLRKAIAEKMADAVNKGAGTKSTTAKTEDKGADKPKDTEKSETTAASSDDKAKAAKEAIAAYLGGSDRDEERSARKKKIVALLSNPKVKKADAPEKVTDLANVNPKAFNAVIKEVNKYIEAGDITKVEASGDDDEIDLG